MNRTIPILLSVFLLAACNTPTAPTRIAVEIFHDAKLTPTELELTLGNAPTAQTRKIATSARVVLVVSDMLAGTSQSISIAAFQGTMRLATGRVQVTPKLGEEVVARVTLARVACGDWCTKGAKECRATGVGPTAGTSVVVCEDTDDDSCMEWGAPVRCAAPTAQCALGTCVATCVDECTTDEVQCAGGEGLRRCGQLDTDSCLEWLPPVACTAGARCSSGACRATCQHECDVDATRCMSLGRSVCGDLDADGCREWSPPIPCGANESCTSSPTTPAVCTTQPATCSDECTQGVCTGTTFRHCGNFDLDSCKELSSGASCTPTDSCLEGACTATGCTTTQKRCNEARPAVCTGENTLRTFDSVGLCASVTGMCAYNSSDRTCANGCEAGRCKDLANPCAGVACQSPPSTCYVAAGTCSNGSCSYAYANAARCDDNDTCTVNDSCSDGLCRGTPQACTTPPSANGCYVAAGTCSGGACSYAFANGNGCDDGDPCTDRDSCSMGVCRGTSRLCSTPPSSNGCYVAAGTCSAGTCSYAYANAGTCDDGDGCTENDSCSNGVCRGSTRSCMTPPPSQCTDASTLRVFNTVGTCSSGTCTYAPSDRVCANGCESGACKNQTDPCAGVTCQTPPNGCYAATGTCTNGTCSYAFANGNGCDDGDACTSGDICTNGTCGGTQLACNTPPAAVCADTNTLQTFDSVGSCGSGTCSYNSSNTSCANGCEAGRCKTLADLCNGVTCQTPLNGCYAATGTCTNGTCSYAFANGTSCNDSDMCTENDSCQAGTCRGTLRACNTPPATTCANTSTLRTFAAIGSCTANSCAYAQQDTPCANGCAGSQCIATVDPCAGITCTTPPSICYGAAGTCSNGMCTYPYANGTACNDNNACTMNDMCNSGDCGGSQIACTTPPASMCMNANLLVTYAASGTCSANSCMYAPQQTACPNGCAAGACNPPPDLCASVVCNTPTSGCYASTGTCSGGLCSYPYANGTSCNDGNACTVGETCMNGGCAGGTTPACTTPPPPTCQSSTVLRTYAVSGSCSGDGCSYPSNDTTCPSGCAAGACNSSPSNAVQVAYLKSTGNHQHARFGGSVAISRFGDTVAVGVPNDEGTVLGGGPGAVYIFRRMGNRWRQEARIVATHRDGWDEFGASVALSADGSTLAVGAPGEDSRFSGIDGDATDNSSSNSGAAYLFKRTGTAWAQTTYIKTPTAIAEQRFGTSISLADDALTIAVGAPMDASDQRGTSGSETSTAAPGAGAVHIFRKSGSVWLRTLYIKANNTDAHDAFGTSVDFSASGRILVIGAPGEDSAGVGVDGDNESNAARNSGAAYIFEVNGGSLNRLAYLKAFNTGANDDFGRAVTISGDGTQVAVGAPFEDSAARGIGGSQSDESAINAGAVYTFWFSGTWRTDSYIKSTSILAADVTELLFGQSVDLTGDGRRLMVGGPGDDSSATGVNGDQSMQTAASSGAAYTFDKVGGVAWTARAYLKASNTEANDAFGNAVCISDDGSVLVAAALRESSNANVVDGSQSNNGALNSGAAYVFSDDTD